MIKRKQTKAALSMIIGTMSYKLNKRKINHKFEDNTFLFDRLDQKILLSKYIRE